MDKCKQNSRIFCSTHKIINIRIKSRMGGFNCHALKYTLKVAISEINLDKILSTGQVFRWRKFDGIWVGVIRRKVWLLKQDEDNLYYDCLELKQKQGTWAVTKDVNRVIQGKNGDKPTSRNTAEIDDIDHASMTMKRLENGSSNVHEDGYKSDETLLQEELFDYFNLSHKLGELSQQWNLENDDHLSGLVTAHSGLRLIRQDPLECLIAFITSSCNNIPRISSLMLKLSSLSQYSANISTMDFHSLPCLNFYQSQNAEKTLRDMGFGYRAKYIVNAMRALDDNGGEEWLHNLRKVPLKEARDSLMEMPGVGPKVASCVCLMGLDKHHAVPIDTHIHQVAIKYYKKSSQTLTPALHSSLETFFQDKHGAFAGWAQAYLFYSNLKRTKPTKSSETELSNGEARVVTNIQHGVLKDVIKSRQVRDIKEPVKDVVDQTAKSHQVRGIKEPVKDGDDQTAKSHQVRGIKEPVKDGVDQSAKSHQVRDVKKPVKDVVEQPPKRRRTRR